MADVTGRYMDTGGLQTDSIQNFSKPPPSRFLEGEQPSTSSTAAKQKGSMTRTEISAPRKRPEKHTETISRILAVLTASVYRYHDFEVKDRLQKLCDAIEKIGPEAEYEAAYVVELLNRLEDESLDQVLESVKKPDHIDGMSEETEKSEAIQTLMNTHSESKNKQKELKPELVCKVCLDNPVAVTFVPCGHLVTCQSCTSALFECPVCRAQIRGTIRTYL